MIVFVIFRGHKSQGGTRIERLHKSMGAIFIVLCEYNPLGLCSAQPAQPAVYNCPAWTREVAAGTERRGQI